MADDILADLTGAGDLSAFASPLDFTWTIADSVAVDALAWSGSPIDSALSLNIGSSSINVHLDEVNDFGIEITDTFVNGDIATGLVTAKGNAPRLTIGLESVMAGDYVEDPIAITSAGVQAWPWAGYTVGAEDDVLIPGNISDRSIWFRYQTAQGGMLTVIGDGGGFWQAFGFDAEADLSTWIQIAEGAMDGTDVIIAVSNGRPIYIRCEPTTFATESGELLWSHISLVPVITLLTNPTSIVQTPSSVRVTLLGALAYSDVEFYVVGVNGNEAIMLTQCDSTGQIVNLSIPMPAVPAGSYTVRAIVIAPSGEVSVSEAQVLVQLDAPTRPTTQAADALPVEVPASIQNGVQKWVLQDATPGGEEWIFPINPSEMGSPHSPRNVTIEQTTAVDGQAILWEAGRKAHEWTFSGYTQSQAFYDALERFLALRHRFWLIDHRNRAWAVSFTAIEWVPRRVPGFDWSFNYTVTAQIYSGPETPA